jgi:hypothetical protein
VHDRHNIAAVLTFSVYDNLRTAPPAQRQVPSGVTGNPPNVPTNILPQDRPFFEYVSERFQRDHGPERRGRGGEAGSFPQFVYYQVGLPSFTTPVWTVPRGAAGSRQCAAPAPPQDARWLALPEGVRLGRRPDFGSMRRVDTRAASDARRRGGRRFPAERARESAGVADPRNSPKHAEFATWLAQQLPQVQVVETKVEARGDNVFLVTATLANEQYLPTQLTMGERIRFNRPITVRLLPARGVTVLTGNIQQQIPRLEGMGGRTKFTWLVQAPAGTRVEMEVFAERAGGLQSVPVTLR